MRHLYLSETGDAGPPFGPLNNPAKVERVLFLFDRLRTVPRTALVVQVRG